MYSRFLSPKNLLLGLCLYAGSVVAQSKQLPYSDMNSWIRREFKESRIIGGNDRVLFEIGKPDSIYEAEAHRPGNSPWETSSVYAKVSGITKGSSTVFPEKRGDGYAARLETRLEEVVVLGIINLKVLATGTIFTGSIEEPIRDSKDPMKKLQQGIPFDRKISGINFDYKVKTGGKRFKSTGFSSSNLPGKNAAEASVILQKRWEDEDGKIYAKRVGTGWVRFDKTNLEWTNGYFLPIKYGDITGDADFQPYMDLITGENTISGKNSKGEREDINEIGWADASEEPTHMIIRFSAGYGGAYVGAIGDMLWIDNVKLVD